MAQRLTGTLDAANETSGVLILQPNEIAIVSLTSAALTGSVVIEQGVKGLSVWKPIQEFVSKAAAAVAVSEYQVKNTSPAPYAVRVRLLSLAAAQEVDFVLEDSLNDYIEQVHASDGRPMAAFTYAGEMKFFGPVLFEQSPQSYEIVRTNDATASELNITDYKANLITSGSEGAEDIEIPNGTSLGQRKLITLQTLGDASDSVDMDYTNLAVAGETISAVEFDAAGEQLLLEWNGVAWLVISATAGVVTST